MILSTTPQIEGQTIITYKGIVFGEVILGVNALKDIGASLRNIFGGRSKGYENSLTEARDQALKELQERAQAMGANAVVGIKMDYEMLGSANDMMMVTCSGTAVVTE